MHYYRRFLLLILVMGIAESSAAALSVFACEPEWASLTRALGGDRVAVVSATTAHQDPHRIEARPSLIAKVRRADLLVCSGAELEIGWLPMLQRQAGNRKVMPGQAGYFAAADQVERLGIPDRIDRSMGDVHASGNPHVHLDPRRLKTIATALGERLASLDSSNAEHYRERLASFILRWDEATMRWQERAQPLRGKRLVVHHQDWEYLFDWLGIVRAGSLEPKPGLPASSGHLAKLKKALLAEPPLAIIHTHYQSPKAARRLSQLTGIPAVELPYTVGGAENVVDLFTLFDETLQRLLETVP
ncbi:MAG: zinc ABC transporter substrate-binding protein [Candidatus Thiodiazotropha sp. (ex. Lucinisca nassula)]|nr:zinc ABC transporter substrate-binding protein [Candidatus Thiodiazotropha sp. (ex. Lucinisca nassula)]MBW9275913.1 zinc ABC transporter substrate-binding protein [Candidatus Thiodiazotropha sp. (ex. Lucinisca nassula)]PUB77909.1 MAG: zinc ABC transporter substrate-binding protein [gamma proteobacterium symbiont of Ctena orbiculata]PUB81280.1 MAG: zinc ABC transporter substrate-binding protein [gamma proteobacterium symbiont of Ctena orbiculata]